jgi:hypothetical protein
MVRGVGGFSHRRSGDIRREHARRHQEVIRPGFIPGMTTGSPPPAAVAPITTEGVGCRCYSPPIKNPRQTNISMSTRVFYERLTCWVLCRVLETPPERAASFKQVALVVAYPGVEVTSNDDRAWRLRFNKLKQGPKQYLHILIWPSVHVSKCNPKNSTCQNVRVRPVHVADRQTVPDSDDIRAGVLQVDVVIR